MNHHNRMPFCRSAAVIAVVCFLAAGCGSSSDAKAASGAGNPAEISKAALQQDESRAGEGSSPQKEDIAPASEVNVPGNEASGKGAESVPSGQVAADDETVSQEQVIKEGMTPVYGNEIEDGVYSVEVDSSSSMFRITACELTVTDGAMEAVITMSGTGYEKLYMGTGEEAVKAAETDYIPFTPDESGAHTFRLPVEALDFGIDCSAFSRKKQKWYDRVLVFRSDSIPADAYTEEKYVTAESLKLEDGLYTAEVLLEGGSGRAAVESPARLRVEDGAVYATIVWGSANYDYMKVNDEKYQWTGEGEHSTFEIPVAGFDWKMTVIADTIAMSTPHEITYTLTFDSSTLKKVE